MNSETPASRPSSEGYAPERAEAWFVLFVFLSALVVNVRCSVLGWSYPLLDIHSFRQTQTAITTYYFLKDGLSLDYITPALGPPWRIPFEFPLYQWIVALLCKATGMALDQAGRFVSLVFFYLCFVPLFHLLKAAKLGRTQILMFFSLFLVSPVYMFWSRTFMIESLALFLSLVYLHYAVRYFATDKGAVYLLAAMLVGSLGALTKITTMAVFFFASSLLAIYFTNDEFRAGKTGRPVVMKYLAFVACAYLVPIVITEAWILRTDQMKEMNPMSASIASYKLKNWNFGTLKMKLSWDTWESIMVNHAARVVGSLGFLILSVVALFVKRHRKLMALCVLSFLAGPAVFTKLYFMHDYYIYASGLFLIALAGFALVSLMDIRWLAKFSVFLLFPAMVVVMAVMYHINYEPTIEAAGKRDMSHYAFLKSMTREDEVIVIIGQGWSSETPYYSERKAIMPWHKTIWPGTPAFNKVIADVGGENIGAVVVCGKCRDDKGEYRQLAHRIGLDLFVSRPDDKCDYYFRNSPGQEPR